MLYLGYRSLKDNSIKASGGDINLAAVVDSIDFISFLFAQFGGSDYKKYLSRRVKLIAKKYDEDSSIMYHPDQDQVDYPEIREIFGPFKSKKEEWLIGAFCWAQAVCLFIEKEYGIHDAESYKFDFFQHLRRSLACVMEPQPH
jgi:hypothetical protein